MTPEERIKELEAEVRYLRSKTDNRKKLTASEAKRIRDMKRDGYTQAEIADIFDVNPATVSRICRGIYH